MWENLIHYSLDFSERVLVGCLKEGTCFMGWSFPFLRASHRCGSGINRRVFRQSDVNLKLNRAGLLTIWLGVV